ncbi:hypothetical protein BKC07_16915 [Peribacillus simplex]|nr:hypothetical protein BKC07_16915 [Peribacillus simplex]
MVRFVSADHVMFKECIEIFRPRSKRYDLDVSDSGHIGFILLDFELTEEWKFEKFEIKPTIKVNLGSIYSAFIAPVVCLEPLESFNTHLFSLAVGSIVSFIVTRPVKTSRDSFFMFNLDTEEGKKERGMYFPIKTTGTGSTNTTLTKQRIDRFYNELKELVDILDKLPYEKYERFMQAIRLVNLAHINKREEFSLSYYLLVSAIESIAQLAIPIKRAVDPNEEEWERLAEEKKVIKSLLNQYKQLRDSGHQLTKRFLTFILEYCPIKDWSNHEHPSANFIDTIRKEFNDSDEFFESLFDKKWNEIYPEDLKEKQLKKIIEDTYRFRSKFTHEGGPTPHINPDSSERFFETVTVFDPNSSSLYTTKYVINHSFLSFITKIAIFNYIREV